VEATEGPLKLIYDFYGFPPQYYKQTWNGTGLPPLANKVAELLKQVRLVIYSQWFLQDTCN
jgi:aromatic ring-opening dioxygenase catalytic subunit (LigB family)